MKRKKEKGENSKEGGRKEGTVEGKREGMKRGKEGGNQIRGLQFHQVYIEDHFLLCFYSLC